MEVKFINVGRSKTSWTAKINNISELTYDWLYKQVKKHLMSTSIDFQFDDISNTGCVYAGVRNVGKFELIAKAEQKK